MYALLVRDKRRDRGVFLYSSIFTMNSEVAHKNTSDDSIRPDFEVGDGIEKQQTLSSSAAIPGSNDEEFTKDAQYGVLAAEAMTTVWSKRDLIVAFVL